MTLTETIIIIIGKWKMCQYQIMSATRSYLQFDIVRISAFHSIGVGIQILWATECTYLYARPHMSWRRFRCRINNACERRIYYTIYFQWNFFFLPRKIYEVPFATLTSGHVSSVVTNRLILSPARQFYCGLFVDCDRVDEVCEAIWVLCLWTQVSKRSATLSSCTALIE